MEIAHIIKARNCGTCCALTRLSVIVFSRLNAVLKMKLIHTMYHDEIIYAHILDIDIECYKGIKCIILLFLLFLCILSPEDQGQP